MPRILVCAHCSCSVPVLPTRNGKASRQHGQMSTALPAMCFTALPIPCGSIWTAVPERDPSNSLCLGCQVTDNGRKRNLRDYVVDVSQRQLGKAFRRQIIEICCPSATVLRYRGYTYSKLHERIGSSTSTRIRPTKPPIFNGSRTSWNPLPTSTRNYHCSSTLDGLFGTARLFFSRCGRSDLGDERVSEGKRNNLRGELLGFGRHRATAD